MYSIDLSCLRDKISDKENLKDSKRRCNDLYQDILINKLSDNSTIINQCDDCIANHNVITQPDNRNIFDAESKGLLGFHFCELKSDNNIYLEIGDKVLVEQEDAIEITTILEKNKIVKFRKAFSKNLEDEKRARPIFCEKAAKFNLEMKLVDVHFQFDRKKLYFFYTANGRVDFRELAKELAGEFKTRIELRQIGVRNEAKKVGGVGTCGREYCCVSFLNSFKRITTEIANEQNPSSNMSKLSGPCGKLKCCLSFEHECK
jgi:hypothetical protein